MVRSQPLSALARILVVAMGKKAAAKGGAKRGGHNPVDRERARAVVDHAESAAESTTSTAASSTHSYLDIRTMMVPSRDGHRGLSQAKRHRGMGVEDPTDGRSTDDEFSQMLASYDPTNPTPYDPNDPQPLLTNAVAANLRGLLEARQAIVELEEILEVGSASDAAAPEREIGMEVVGDGLAAPPQPAPGGEGAPPQPDPDGGEAPPQPPVPAGGAAPPQPEEVGMWQDNRLPAVWGSSQISARLEQDQPRCRCCGCMVELLERGVRFFTKCQMWQCSKCNSRHVGLIRLFGTSKFAELEAFTPQQKEDFFKSLPTDTAGLKKTVSEVIVKHRMSTRRNAVHGEFLPLSVWASRGFDTSSIEAQTDADDKEDHPVLGMTYRVKLRASTDVEDERNIRKQIFGKVGKAIKVATAVAAETEDATV